MRKKKREISGERFDSVIFAEYKTAGKDGKEKIEKIKRPFFPLKRMVNDLEKLMIHWGEWYSNNLKKS